MNSYLVSARKYRPEKFEDVIGQGHITESLKNAIKLNTISHAYIFCGPRGVGKTTCARIFAKQLNLNTQKKHDFSFNIFELDAASNNSVDDIRDLVNQVKIPPQIGSYKVYIIDEAHMLSKSAFNAFLKTLEEPPKHCIFILATTEKEKIIPTILSRCQIFDFKRISEEDICNYLLSLAEKENIQTEEENIKLIAKNADGALRDALSTFDKVHSFCGKKWIREKVLETLHSLDENKITFFVKNIKDKNIPTVLVEFDSILKNGFEGDSLISGLIDYYRNIMVSKNPISLQLLKPSDKLKKEITELSSFYSTKQIIQILNTLSQCQKDYTQTTNKRFIVELCLMQLCSINDIDELKKKIKIKKSNQSVLENSKKNTGITEKLKDIDSITVIKDESTNNNQDIQENNKKKSLLGTTTIEEILSPEKEKEEVIEEIVEKESKLNTEFSEELLISTINDFCSILKKEKKINLHSTLQSNKPELINNNLIVFKLSSNSQKKEIIETKVELLSFLKKNLKNDLIEIKIELTKKEPKELLYTNQEKLNYMLKKNPELENVIKSLDLEFLN